MRTCLLITNDSDVLEITMVVMLNKLAMDLLRKSQWSGTVPPWEMVGNIVAITREIQWAKSIRLQDEIY